MLQLLDFNENPNLGIYGRANDHVVFLQKNLLKKVKNKISSGLYANIIELSIADSTIIGSLLALNSYGAVVTEFADQHTVDKMKEQGLDVYPVKDVINAAGNDILVNDNGALIHPDMSIRSMKNIGETLGVSVKKGTIASLKTIGMAAVVTNKGCLCHPKVTDDEKKQMEKLFDVEVMIGTVNHGVPIVGSGIVANSKGAIVGNLTTGIEMGRIEEALGFLD
ncbi:MAG: translation initiation factor IF-6 [Petrotogales bacterium]